MRSIKRRPFAQANLDPLARSSLNDWFGRAVLVVPFAELWRTDYKHPARARLVELGVASEQLTFTLTSVLLLNVIHAGAAISYAADKIETLLDADQEWLDEHLDPDAQLDGVAGPNRDAINFEFSNLLFWIKALEERLRSSQVKVDGESFQIGLLDALAPDEPWTRKIRDLHGALSHQVFRDRHLANFATHASAIPYPFSSAKVVDRQVAVPVPDILSAPVYHWFEFTYEQERELRGLVRNVVGSVERFMDGLLDAFEGANREIQSRRAAKV
jgi:hypothetical protein